MTKLLNLAWKIEKKMAIFDELLMEKDLKSYSKRLLRFVTIGSVDDGKSTLIGRLLFDAKALMKDQYEALQTLDDSSENINLAFITDGLKSERALGITIDVAYRYFSSPKRKFIIADAPGHLEYTKNMVTACSRADVAVLLIDVRFGLLDQTKRHLFLASLLQVRHVAICINKMDLVNFSEDRFEEIKEICIQYASKLQIVDLQFFPTVATDGDNIVERSSRMPWYQGTSLLYYLENVHIDGDENCIDCRFPIQYVQADVQENGQKYFAYQGRVASGIFKKGDEVMILPSKQITSILKIYQGEHELQEAPSTYSIQLLLTDNPTLKRGDMIVRPHNFPQITDSLDTMLFWLSDDVFDASKQYLLIHTHRQLVCQVTKIYHKIDIDSLHRVFPPFDVGVNDIVRVVVQVDNPLYVDAYHKNKVTGSLILVDEKTLETVAAAVII